MLATLVFFPLLVAARPLHSKIFFMTIGEARTNPLVMEAKAYCASRDYISNVFLSANQFKFLPDIADYVFLNRSKKSLKTPVRKFKDLVMTKSHFESPVGLSTWMNYTHNDFVQTARINLTVGEDTVVLNSAINAKHTAKWKFSKVERISEVQEWIRLRSISLSSKSYTTYFTVLDNLFARNSLSSELYTLEIEDYLKENNLYPTKSIQESLETIKFEVIGCAEKLEDQFKKASVIIALKIVQNEEKEEEGWFDNWF